MTLATIWMFSSTLMVSYSLLFSIPVFSMLSRPVSRSLEYNFMRSLGSLVSSSSSSSSAMKPWMKLPRVVAA